MNGPVRKAIFREVVLVSAAVVEKWYALIAIMDIQNNSSISKKCDGKRPICTQCDRAGRAEDCEYTVGQERSTVQILEENISRLEARIQELQNPTASPSTSIELHQPYGVSPSADQTSRSANSHSLLQDLPAHLAEAL